MGGPLLARDLETDHFCEVLRDAGVADGLSELSDESAGDGRGVASIDHLHRQDVQSPDQLSAVWKLVDLWLQQDRDDHLQHQR